MNFLVRTMKKNIGVNLFIAFSFFVFAPLEIYLTNQANFWFSIKPVIVCSLTAFLIVFLLCVLVDISNNKYINISKGVLWGIFIAFYIQGNFLNGNYGSLDGTAINWETGFSSLYRVLNVTEWILIIGISFLIYKKKKWVSQIIGCCLVLTQVITITVLLIGGGLQDKTQINATKEHQFEFSTGKNIIVVCADGFDSVFFEKAIEENTEIYDWFDGFVYYKNTIGSSYYTDESIIPLLTGNILEEDGTYKDNVKRAYTNSSLFPTLYEKNYKVGIYEQNSAFLDSTIVDIAENLETTEASVKSYGGLGQLLYKLVSFKYMPHELKQYFWISTMEFSSTKVGGALDYYSWDNLEFYEDITKTIKVVEDGMNRYKFYHIQGPHEPVVMDANLQPVKNMVETGSESYSEGRYQQTLGVIKIFAELVKQLKEKGIYDNSTIIFTADHGWDVRARPLLMIKQANSSVKNMLVSEVPVSIPEDYLITLETIVNENWSNDKAIFNLTDEERSRPFYIYDINDDDRTYNDRADYLIEAKTAEEIENLATWTYMFMCELSRGDTAPVYVDRFNHDAKEYAWLEGNEVNLMFQLDGDYNNILLGLKYAHVYHGQQRVEIYANNKKIADYTACENEEKQFIIPKEYIREKQLQLTLKFPNATSPKENGESDDKRVLSLCMTGMYLMSTDDIPQENL